LDQPKIVVPHPQSRDKRGATDLTAPTAVTELERAIGATNLKPDATAKTAPSDHLAPPMYDVQRNKLTGDRRAGESPPAGVRLSDGLGIFAIRRLVADHLTLAF